MLVIGLDVGTTGTKAVVVDKSGNTLGSGYREYALKPELVLPGGIAGDVGFVNTAGTHDPPFVVIACQHQFANAGELIVLGNEGGIQVAVVIDNGKLFGMVLIEPPGSGVFQHEIGGNNTFDHSVTPSLKIEISR